ncbi:MutS-related protein [Niabella aquatica]
MATVYKERAKKFRQKADQLKQQSGWLSFARLLSFAVFIFLLYLLTQKGSGWMGFFTAAVFAAFVYLVRCYGKLQQKRQYFSALADCNEKEEHFLQTNKSSYDAGKEYEDPHHPYSYDLDLFSEDGLFSYLNRCSTSFGKEALAQDLLTPDSYVIKERQEAIKELAGAIDFRQELYAHGSLHQARKKDLERLMHWIDSDTKLVNTLWYYLLMVFPLCTIGSLVYYAVTESETAFSLFTKLFVVNLIIAFSFSKKITSQLSVSTAVTKILQNFSNQLRLIETQGFQASLFKQYQQVLNKNGIASSRLIGQLASLFNYLETVVNLVVSLLLNGLFLFHVHILYRLGHWKKQHAHEIKGWLRIIGKIESLSSLGNLSYNNPSFCFPEVKEQPAFSAVDLGHILVKKEKRVCNDVSFNQQRFVILTGSNMSGKSTFLRTLGSNLVLARSGAAVCASSFEFYPFDIFVSMRITDSLQDSESLFYAELKRLQSIIRALEGERHLFVILDEILRGTNSNDKRHGTIGLIRKMAGFNTFGIIATHDIIVADLVKEYPAFIANKAFESTIINDELLFDYKLKDGVCHTLSASYLMKKMEII